MKLLLAAVAFLSVVAVPQTPLNLAEKLELVPISELTQGDFVECFSDAHGVSVYANVAENCPKQEDFDKKLKAAAKQEGLKDLGMLRGMSVYYHPGVFVTENGVQAWGLAYPDGTTFVSTDAKSQVKDDVELHELRHQTSTMRYILANECIDGDKQSCAAIVPFGKS